MASASTKATIYLDPVIHKALRMKAAVTSRSMSELVNNALKEALAEDEDDLSAFVDRAHDSMVSYESMLKELKKNGQI